MRWIAAGFCALGVFGAIDAATAADCPGNPNAIGTSRILSIDPTEHARLGTMQYAETLPLADKEVVLTFDDGPLPPYTTRVLDILASECVKATYFVVGNMARAYPDVVRKIYAAGHTIGTHSQSHPMTFKDMPLERVEYEIEAGIAETAAALGNPQAVAPFFRIPGLSRSAKIEAYLHERGLMTWSADFPADDWKHIQASEILDRALRRIERKGKGILLLHDIQPATVLALPALLKELKARGYRIVHVVPAGVERPKTVTAPQDWILVPVRHRPAWPRVVSTSAKHTLPEPQSEAAPSVPASVDEPTSTQSIKLPPLGMTSPVHTIHRKPKLQLSRPTYLAPLVL